MATFRGQMHVGRISVAAFAVIAASVVYVALFQTRSAQQGSMRYDHSDGATASETLEFHRQPRIPHLFSDSEIWSADAVVPVGWELSSQDKDGAIPHVKVNEAEAPGHATPWRGECLRSWRSHAEGQRAQIACQRWALQEWPGNGVLIYTCRGSENQKCGGLADRTRGMVFMYWLAVIRRSAFFIDLRRPTRRRLEAFWLPAGDLNWTLPVSRRSMISDTPAKAKGPAMVGNVVEAMESNGNVLPHIDRNLDSQCRDVKRLLALQDQHGRKVLRFSTTHQYECARQIFAKHHARVAFSHVTWISTSNYLFKASPRLRTLDQEFKATSNWSPSNSVCIHLRSGGPIGPEGFQVADNLRTELPVRQTMYRCALDIQAQWIRHKLHVGLEVIAQPSSYLVVVDHAELLDEARQHIGSRQILSTASFGPMLHIDKVSLKLQSQPSLRKEVEMGEERAYLDHYLLSQCRYAVVDSSGFAWTAFNFSLAKRLVLRPKRDIDMCTEVDETTWA